MAAGSKRPGFGTVSVPGRTSGTGAGSPGQAGFGFWSVKRLSDPPTVSITGDDIMAFFRKDGQDRFGFQSVRRLSDPPTVSITGDDIMAFFRGPNGEPRPGDAQDPGAS